MPVTIDNHNRAKSDVYFALIAKGGDLASSGTAVTGDGMRAGQMISLTSLQAIKLLLTNCLPRDR